MIDPEVMPADYSNLLKTIHTMDLRDDQRLVLADALDKVLDSMTRRRRILKLIQTAMTDLRLDMKYLMFDLEATARERDTALEKK